VLDARTLALPWYDGNGMFLSAGNVLVNPEVGLLFVSFEEQRRLSLNGTASIHSDDADPAALFTVRVHVREVFPNCPRYIHRYQLVERSRFVPRGDAPPPVPDWKRQDWACDVLPAGDAAHRHAASQGTCNPRPVAHPAGQRNTTEPDPTRRV